MSRIVAKRLICFDEETWGLISKRKGISSYIRMLVRGDKDEVKTGRPRKKQDI